MARVLLAVVVAATAIGAITLSGIATGQGSTDSELFAHLRGTNEVNGQGQRAGGDRNAFGSAAISIDAPRLCFGLAIRGTDRPVAAHIHRGRRNQNGPVVVTLGQGEEGEVPSSGDPGSASACATAPAAIIRAIRRNPGGFYVNVHTNDHAGGALRGQLFRAPRR